MLAIASIIGTYIGCFAGQRGDPGQNAVGIQNVLQCAVICKWNRGTMNMGMTQSFLISPIR
jgi:hypothetical protein